MKKSLKSLTLLIAFSASTQIMNAQNKEPQKEEAQEKVLGLELGAKLPEVSFTSQDDKELPLAAAVGHRWVFVFFYPKALTGG